jgi:hypothetical protein
MVMLQDFMDPWTFNQKNLMKCCKEFLLPDGKQIPFCAYNTLGYREQARAQLEARERSRNRARRDGAPWEPEPLTFTTDIPYPQDVRKLPGDRGYTIGRGATAVTRGPATPSPHRRGAARPKRSRDAQAAAPGVALPMATHAQAKGENADGH